MRDAFLIFLMLLVPALLASYGLFLRWALSSNDDDTEDDDDDGDFGCLLIIIGIVVIAVCCSLLYTVGHAVGVQMPSEWK